MQPAPDDPTTPVPAPRPPPAARRRVVLAIRPPATIDEVPAMCDRVRELVEASDAEIVVCDVSALAPPDPVALEVLCRLTLTVRRLGRELRIRHAGEELLDLVGLVGLCDDVPLDG